MSGSPTPTLVTKKVDIAAATKDGLLDLDARQGRRDDLKRLAHSGQEVSAIAKLFGAQAEYVLTGAKRQRSQGQGCVPRRIGWPRARYIHFATHGIIGQDEGKQPALVLNLVGNKTEDGFLHMDEDLRA